MNIMASKLIYCEQPRPQRKRREELMNYESVQCFSKYHVAPFEED